MRQGLLALLPVLLGLPSTAFALQWTAHTSSREVNALSPAQDAVWVGSSGGVFRYEVSTGEISQFTAAQGLHDVEPRAVAYDGRRGVLWTGYADGAIDRIDEESGAVTTYYDMVRSDRFPSKGINHLRILGDSLLVATSFGLVVFDPVRAEVRDTYSQLGTLSSPVAVRDILVAPLPQSSEQGLWLATDQGVAYASLDAPNLQDPAAWSVEKDVRPSEDLNAIAALDGTVYVGSNFGLSRREDSGTYLNTSVTSRPVRQLALLPDRLVALTPFNVLGVFGSGGVLVLADGFVDLRTIAVSSAGNLWVGDAEVGLNYFEQPAGNDRPALITGAIYPDGPYDSPFGDLAVDDSGTLWAAAVEGIPRSGFYKLSGGQWSSYTERFYDELRGRSNYWRIYADRQGNAWAGSRGNGLAQVDASGAIALFDHANTTLLPAVGTSSFVIVSGTASDAEGRLWVTNMVAPRPLHVRTSDGEWTALNAPYCTGLGTTQALGDIIVDSAGLKWILVHDRNDLRLTIGVAVLDTQGTPTDTSDDACQFFGGRGAAGRGLPDDQVNAVVEDGQGRIWVGTDEGPAFFVPSTLTATDASVDASWPVWTQNDRTTYMMRGLVIHDIATDPGGGLWFATNEGVFAVNDQNGFSLDAHFTAGNSPLFSDNVNAIAADGTTGLIYMATDKGLISYQSDAINPAESAQSLFVYPNPVVLSGDQVPRIYIERLTEETTIKILTITGELVQTIAARGGKASWDGRDRNGQWVPSGIYLVVALSSSGKGTAFGKVAVIQ